MSKIGTRTSSVYRVCGVLANYNIYRVKKNISMFFNVIYKVLRYHQWNHEQEVNKILAELDITTELDVNRFYWKDEWFKDYYEDLEPRLLKAIKK